MPVSLTRRRLLQRAAAASAAVAAPAIVPASVLGQLAPSNRIAVGFIGLGGHGVGRNLRTFLHQPDATPVVLCDCDLRQLPGALAEVKKTLGDGATPDTTQDWRTVIERADIDAVMISTPDHWHVPMTIAAAKAGKDVICEKPTLTVAEGRAMVQTIERYRTVFQTSTEDRALPMYHRLAELVRNGAVGKLHTIRVTLPVGDHRGDPTPQPIPEGFDYDMWLGPAPEAPYTKDRCHFHFRWIADYSGGILTDWGMHLLDTAQWANDTEHTGPIRVAPRSVEFYSDGLYDTARLFELEYEYANGVKLIVSTGGTGIRCEGDRGWIESASWTARLTASDPALLDLPSGPGVVRLYTNPGGEHRDFLDAVKTRRDPYFPAEIGHRCASIQHIGNIALTLGRTLRWDPAAERFPDDDTANRLLTRAMREPWGI